MCEDPKKKEGGGRYTGHLEKKRSGGSRENKKTLTHSSNQEVKLGGVRREEHKGV